MTSLVSYSLQRNFFGNFHNQLNSFLKCVNSLTVTHNFLWAPHIFLYQKDLKLLSQKNTFGVQEIFSTTLYKLGGVTLYLSGILLEGIISSVDSGKSSGF